MYFEKEQLNQRDKIRRDGTRECGTRDGMGLKKKNEAGWDQTGQEDAGYGTTFWSSRGALVH